MSGVVYYSVYKLNIALLQSSALAGSEQSLQEEFKPEELLNFNMQSDPGQHNPFVPANILNISGLCHCPIVELIARQPVVPAALQIPKPQSAGQVSASFASHRSLPQIGSKKRTGWTITAPHFPISDKR